jgi:flagellin-like hook-associated protein FlgL
MLQGILSSAEGVDTSDVAAQLLTAQTQLQASYQATAMLSKLSLVNFLG